VRKIYSLIAFGYFSDGFTKIPTIPILKKDIALLPLKFFFSTREKQNYDCQKG
jgi:hypothetical protein